MHRFLHPPTPLQRVLRTIAPALVGVTVFSLCINLLLFVAPLFMINLYSRAVPTRSVETLLALFAIAVFLTGIYGALEAVRARVLVRVGLRIDEMVASTVFATAFRAAVTRRQPSQHQAVRDVDQVRDFFSGSAIFAFCDAPWTPIFIFGCFLIHPYFGGLAIFACLLTIALSIANEFVSRPALSRSGPLNTRAESLMMASHRNGEAIWAMGMVPAVTRRWARMHTEAVSWQATGSDKSGLLLSATKFVRQVISMSTLALAAYLAIEREISPAVIFAINILVSRSILPVEHMMQNWRSFGRTRAAYGRLQDLLSNVEADRRMRLADPQGQLSVEGVYAGPPGVTKPILRNINFAIEAGSVLAIVGPSAAGKSTLARVLIGLWPPVTGTVRLDGAEVGHFDPHELGRHLGYVPQDVELFDGTISENIARLETPDPTKVLAASALAGTHDLIQSLPEGYNTRVGGGGVALSGGQRQRIALARAVYGDPALIILDEPNSNLDATGDDLLQAAIAKLRQRGTTVVVITHKAGLLAAADKVLVLDAGSVAHFGTRDEVLQKLRRGTAAPVGQVKLKPVGLSAS
ncbi:type I secretion system permease/ATPase [Methylobacterium sp. WL103]|uniref:type I secretion system permease/ATPase n=1 Tax=Methylobacterium sp. WL103 TaxID=2603891 RepID=UPI0011CA46D3|nr:type I secretion system permease/ATPase [Methylobacterium sp. WL103]TXN07161.1 type I secretion system permease/ATPase [Methylobacterium sp. WL103]